MISYFYQEQEEFVEMFEKINFDNQDQKYKNLLQMQQRFIRANKSIIIEKAEKLYEYVVIKKDNFYMEKSCDLEKLIKEYKKFSL